MNKHIHRNGQKDKKKRENRLTHKHPYTQIDTHTYIYTQMDTHRHTHGQTHIRKHTHKWTHTHKRTQRKHTSAEGILEQI